MGGQIVDYYIYLTTNPINGKQYIGQHKGKPDDGYLGSGTGILRAIAKYGKENFTKEILCFCETREEADQKEREYIKQYNAVEDKNFYNYQEGGNSADGWRSCQRWLKEHPEEAKEMYRKNAERLQEWRINHPEEYYEKALLPFLEGSKKYWESHPEQRAELMERVNQEKEKWQREHPEEHKKQVDTWRMAGSIANSQKIICITTGKVFDSQSEAGRYYNIPQGNISKCLRGERVSAGKHPTTGEKLIWKKL
jgi:group I intron endonuclease